MQFRLLTIGVWLLVGVGALITYFQWQQLSGLEELSSRSDAALEPLADVAAVLESPLLVNISDVSVNEGISGVDGGFIQIAPLMLVDEEGEFDQFFRLPVSVSEPVDVRVGNEVDVWITGGFVETD